MPNCLQTGEDLSEDVPCRYAEEGDQDTNTELDAISIPEVPFDPHWDLDFTIRSLTSPQMPHMSMTGNITTAHEIRNLQNNTLFPNIGNWKWSKPWRTPRYLYIDIGKDEISSVYFHKRMLST